jgi:DNA ligase D-like protein (predicted ligase)/DNA ligase D-like protein (predicted polymerase)/DNA ligase D-like protein (predicted 3'-phosphoesterase)
MPSEYIHTEIDGIRVKLSNLDKNLYPDSGIIKSEVIQYYLTIAEHLLSFSANRPLTLVRYPDGIAGEHFFARNIPKWTPEWVSRYKLPWDSSNTYLTLENKANLIWLANLAALEIHAMNCRIPNPAFVDHFIVDLDPDVGYTFSDLKTLAFSIKSFLQGFGYKVFVKTSGGKGLHLAIPLIPNCDHDTLMKVLKKIFIGFTQEHPETTLQVHKDKRKGKVLLDIYRNHRGNTTVIPFSLRGKPGAPVSMPILWKHLETVKTAQDFTITNHNNYLQKNGNAWENMFKHAVELHTKRKLKPKKSKPESLIPYEKKRDFKETPEPVAELDPGINDRFVIHLHAARNLHYDLRLGVDGVLKSWAIPKGLPIRPKVKRLAISTEDHPAKYIDFEGHIPKGQYGAGDMWIYRTGSINWLKKESKKLSFELTGGDWKAKFKMYNTKEDQWLIERMDVSARTPKEIKIDPMLAGSRKSLPKSRKYSYEIKWDGIRAIFYINGDEVQIISRNGREVTQQFPELAVNTFCDVEHAILDAEIVCLDAKGSPVFSEVISRLHSLGDRKIMQLSKTKPAVAYFFDVVYLDGKELLNLSLTRRQAWLAAIVDTGNSHRISKVFSDGNSLWKAAKELGLEGVMAKDPASKYTAGMRSDDWLKIKFRQNIQLYIIGYTEGKGERRSLFGAMHVAEKKDAEWLYRGKVGTGFDDKVMKEVLAVLKTTPSSPKIITETIEEESRTKWIKAIHQCELNYASITGNETLREPVFIRLIKGDNPSD